MGRHNESSRGHRGDRDNADSRRHRHHRHRHRDDDDGDDGGAVGPNERGSGSHSRHRRHRDRSTRRGDDRRDGGGEGGRDRRDNLSRSSRRHPRLDRRDVRNSSGDDNDDDLASRRGREGQRHTRRRGHRDRYDGDGGNDEGTRRGRKRRRSGGRGGDDGSDESDGDDFAEGRRGQTNQAAVRQDAPDYTARHTSSLRDGVHATATTTSSAAATVDWSSRRGRQRMPPSAYDVGQQKRLLGFLDGHASAKEMTFDIGPDGLVQMPPPNTLVRHRRGGTAARARPPTYSDSRTPAADANGEKDDEDNHSVASHESLYDDPATAHLGVLPDVFPPSHLFRVALYGVELAVTAKHLRSIVTQLLGKAANPYRVRRPAREMLQAAMAYTASITDNAPKPSEAPKPSSSGVLHGGEGKDYETCEASAHPTSSSNANTNNAIAGGILDDDAAASHEGLARSAGVLSSAPSAGVLPDAPGVLAEDGAASGVLGSGGGPGQESKNDDVGVEKEEEEGILPDASSLPVPPPPAVPVFYLPGLHDVNGPGGMVVLEFAEQEHASRVVQVLNGGYINGRRIAASM